MSASLFPAPTPSPETEAFWTAARDGKFLLRYCTACARPHWYPRAICPFCCEATEWREASGKASIYSYSVTRKGAEAHIMAFVTLDEGPIMMTNIVDCDPGRLSIGQPVTVTFRPSTDAGPPVPVFIPAQAGQGAEQT